MCYRSAATTPTISIFHAQGDAEPLHVIETLHSKPISLIKYNVAFDIIISVDQAGILEYWTGPKTDYKFPAKVVSFESKLDTDLYEFVKAKTLVIALDCSCDGKRFATLSTDRKVRVFNFLSGKLIRVYDETLPRYHEMQQTGKAIPNMEFGRKYANNFCQTKCSSFMEFIFVSFAQNGNRARSREIGFPSFI